jgi:hypothetical protein
MKKANQSSNEADERERERERLFRPRPEVQTMECGVNVHRQDYIGHGEKCCYSVAKGRSGDDENKADENDSEERPREKVIERERKSRRN